MLLKQILSIKLRAADTVLQLKSFHNSAAVLLDNKWRDMNRLHQNVNAFGPLTNMPDYSFKDGRPTPFGVKQMIRINKQRKYLEDVKKLSGEIDYAVERHSRLEAEKAKERQRIIDNKLKPKGHVF